MKFRTKERIVLFGGLTALILGGASQGWAQSPAPIQPCDGSDHRACMLVVAGTTIGQQAVELAQLRAQIAELSTELAALRAEMKPGGPNAAPFGAVPKEGQGNGEAK